MGAAEWLQNLALTNFHEHLRCDDGDAATTNGICYSGTCQGCPAPTDDCEVAGMFDAVTQNCSPLTVKTDGTTCDSATTDILSATLKLNTPIQFVYSIEVANCLRIKPSHFDTTIRCDDGNAQTTNGICYSGTCQGCPAPTDECEVAGTFDALTQNCSPPTVKADGTACGARGTCNAGVCTGAWPSSEWKHHIRLQFQAQV